MDLKLDKNNPIGFMDSGLGGISVLKEAIKLMPSEDFIYYGDSLNAPYGTKPQEEIRRLTFDVVDKLLGMGIKGLAVACNTATSAAVRALRIKYPTLPIVGIEPAIKPAVEASRGGEIIVMATPMTIRQEKFKNLLSIYSDKAQVIPLECEGLMEFVEAGILEGEVLDSYFKKKLLPVLSDKTEGIVLGCTHYPFLKKELSEFLANDAIKLYDGAYGTSKELMRRLKEANLLREDKGIGRVRIINSSQDKELIARSKRLLNMEI